MRAGPLLHHATSPMLPRARGRPPSRRPVRLRALLAGAAVLAGATILAALHMLPASRRIDPLSQPLSQYAFAPNGWLFDVAVLTLAFGLAVLVSALVRGSCLGRRSPARLLLSTCSLSLVLLVVFRDHAANGALRTTGLIHWVAAMLAFGGLSAAPAVLGHHRAGACSRLTSLARRLSLVTGPCFVVALAVSLLQYETRLPLPTWSFGTTERVLVAGQLILAGVLVAWAWRGCTCQVDDLGARRSRRRGRPDRQAGRGDQMPAPAPVRHLPVCAADHGEAEPPARLIA